MPIELKPCPFCGDDIARTHADVEYGGRIYYVECPCCAARGGYDSTESGADGLWNRRAVPAEMAGSQDA